MAEYRPIKTKIWNDTWFLTLNPEEKLVWLFLLTNSYLHISGIYELPKTLISPLTGSTKWQEILAKFEKDGKIEYKDGWIYLKNYLKNQNKQIDKKNSIKDNVYKAISNYLTENPNIITLFNLPSQDPYKGLISPLQYPSERLKTLKSKVLKIKDETVEEVKTSFLKNPLMEKLKIKYPDRDYEFLLEEMCQWYLSKKKRLPQTITAFSNWLKNTKVDEAIRNERLRLEAKKSQEAVMAAMENQPRASKEKVDELKQKMKGIGKSI